MRAIDTNVLVRLITRDHPAQTAAAEKFVAKGAWVQLSVLMETMWVLSRAYHVPDPALATAIKMLLHHEQLTIQDPETVTAALALYENKPSLGFSDCLILQVARKAGHLPLGTFDRNLAKCEGAEKIPG